METKHTKGNWAVFSGGKQLAIKLSSHNGLPLDGICLIADKDSIKETEANAKLIAAAPELLNSAILDNMFPTTTPKEQVEAEEFAESLGWKWDMPLEHFARQYRTKAIKKATE